MKVNTAYNFSIPLKAIRPLLTAFIIIFYPALRAGAESSYLSGPVDVKNTHILYISHLFMPIESSSVTSEGNNFINAGAVLSNTNYMFDENGKKGNFDLETKTFIFSYTRRINETTEFRFCIPFYYNSGGFMDEMIESFHDAIPFSVRNGGREFVDDNEIHISYNADGGGPDINSSFYGAGDPSFFLKKVFYNDGLGLTGCLGIKPWAGARRFINSNTTDAGITLSADYSRWIFSVFGTGGFTCFFGEGTYKEELEQKRDWILILAAGAGMQLSGTIYAAVQFYCNTSPYSTGIVRMDNISVINSWAIRWQPVKKYIIQFSVDEDTFTYVTTDIAFSLRCGYVF